MSQDLFKTEPTVARFSAADIYRNLEIAALQDIAKRFEEADSLVDILKPSNTPPSKPAEIDAAPKPVAEIIHLPIALRKSDIIPNETRVVAAVPAAPVEPSAPTAPSADIIQLLPSVRMPQPALFKVACIPGGQYRSQIGSMPNRRVSDEICKRSSQAHRLSPQQMLRMSKRSYGAPAAKKRSQPKRLVQLR